MSSKTHSKTQDLARAPYAKRRARLASALGPGGLAIIATAPECTRNRDNTYPYRHDSYFYYLTGFSEPGAWLVLAAGGHSTLFCQPRDPARETWTGLRLGPQAAPEALGVDEAFSSEDLASKIPELMEGCSCIWYPFATHEGLEGRISEWLTKIRSKTRLGFLVPQSQGDLCAILDEMRLTKDEHELALMRQAAKISAAAHVSAMQCCAAMLRSGKDVREYHLEAQLLYEFRRHGAQGPAFGSIVASGENACVLHYQAGSSPIRSGQLVLMDAGCEFGGYAGDISRTFAASGRFSGPQRQLYELVLAGQNAAAAATRAGARFNEPHEACLRVLTQGLMDLDIISGKTAHTLDDALEKKAYFPFFMHRTSHWLGMDVHDCGSYVEPSEKDKTHSRVDPISGETIIERPSRVLQPGMVLTLEPGLYVRASKDVPEQFWNTAVRIEDDAVVTQSGCELITRDVPVAAHELEKLMA